MSSDFRMKALCLPSKKIFPWRGVLNVFLRQSPSIFRVGIQFGFAFQGIFVAVLSPCLDEAAPGGGRTHNLRLQYTAFLNAVAQTDIYGLSNTNMARIPISRESAEAGQEGAACIAWWGGRSDSNILVGYCGRRTILGARASGKKWKESPA